MIIRTVNIDFNLFIFWGKQKKYRIKKNCYCFARKKERHHQSMISYCWFYHIIAAATKLNSTIYPYLNMFTNWVELKNRNKSTQETFIEILFVFVIDCYCCCCCNGVQLHKRFFLFCYGGFIFVRWQASWNVVEISET